MILRRAILLLAATLSLGACHGSQVLPPVTPAPLSACLTFVLKDDRALSNAYDRDVQNGVRKSIETAMVGAGFNILNDPALPHDLLAEIATVPGSRVESSAHVKVKLTLTSQGRAVDQIEVSTSQESPDYGGVVADQVVDAVFRSAPLAAFTRDLRKPEAKQHLASGALRAALTPVCAQTADPAASSSPVTPPTSAPPAAALTAPPAATGLIAVKPDPTAYAFIVGIEDYKSAPKAAGGKADAARFMDLARQTLGVEEAHIKLVVGDKADKLAFDLTLEWLKQKVPRGGRVYFYFSGHGALRRQTMTPFLLPNDGDPRALDKTAIPLGAFLQALGQTKARDVLAILDAGFSGVGARSAPLPDGAPPKTLSDPEIPPKVAFFSAVTSAEGASVGAEGGVFSRVVFDALGHGRADIDGDGQISLQELLAWAGPRVAREAKRAKSAQTPSLLLGPGMGAAGQFVVVSGLPMQ